MDINELAKIVETGFKDLGNQISGVDTRVGNRLDGVETRLDRVETRLDGMDHRIDNLTEVVHFQGIQIDGLRGDIRQVAEGVAMVNEKLDRHIADTTLHSASGG